MSGLVVFSFKTPSLPRFDQNTRCGEDPVIARNLRSLFGEVDPRSLRRCFSKMRATLQRAGEMDRARGAFPMAVDGTGHPLVDALRAHPLAAIPRARWKPPNRPKRPNPPTKELKICWRELLAGGNSS